jgi:hypothetical protein
MIDMIGVIPLPPASSRRSASRSFGVKIPAGGSTFRRSPGCSFLQIHPDAYPCGVCFTVIVSGASSSTGVEESE